MHLATRQRSLATIPTGWKEIPRNEPQVPAPWWLAALISCLATQAKITPKLFTSNYYFRIFRSVLGMHAGRYMYMLGDAGSPVRVFLVVPLLQTFPASWEECWNNLHTRKVLWSPQGKNVCNLSCKVVLFQFYYDVIFAAWSTNSRKEGGVVITVLRHWIQGSWTGILPIKNTHWLVTTRVGHLYVPFRSICNQAQMESSDQCPPNSKKSMDQWYVIAIWPSNHNDQELQKAQFAFSPIKNLDPSCKCWLSLVATHVERKIL